MLYACNSSIVYAYVYVPFIFLHTNGSRIVLFLKKLKRFYLVLDGVEKGQQSLCQVFTAVYIPFGKCIPQNWK